MSSGDFLSRLEAVKRTGEGRWIARCPAHADRRASLSIRELEDGRVLVHDFAGCSVGEVLDAVGLGFDALYPPKPVGYAPAERRPYSAADVLQALSAELTLISVIAIDLQRGRALAKRDLQRLQVAIERVQAGREMALGR